MMVFFRQILVFSFICFFVPYSLGKEHAQQQEKNAQTKIAPPAQRLSEMDKIVKEYKEHLSSIEPGLRRQVVQYRKKISKINEQKRNLFRKLPSKVQEYLVIEAQYKEKLEKAAKSHRQNIKKSPPGVPNSAGQPTSPAARPPQGSIPPLPR